jgi:hypothetical protein
MIDSCITLAFSANKVVNSSNFAAGGITNHRTRHNSLCRDKNKHYVTSYVMGYKAVRHVTLPAMCDLFVAPTLVAQKKQRLIDFGIALTCEKLKQK